MMKIVQKKENRLLACSSSFTGAQEQQSEFETGLEMNHKESHHLEIQRAQQQLIILRLIR